jgi:hypothetical protein
LFHEREAGSGFSYYIQKSATFIENLDKNINFEIKDMVDMTIYQSIYNIDTNAHNLKTAMGVSSNQKYVDNLHTISNIMKIEVQAILLFSNNDNDKDILIRYSMATLSDKKYENPLFLYYDLLTDTNHNTEKIREVYKKYLDIFNVNYKDNFNLIDDKIKYDFLKAYKQKDYASIAKIDTNNLIYLFKELELYKINEKLIEISKEFKKEDIIHGKN